MMNKLTIKQAEWLIEKMNTYYITRGGSDIRIDDAIEIINRCTKKEFPKINMGDTFFLEGTLTRVKPTQRFFDEEDW